MPDRSSAIRIPVRLRWPIWLRWLVGVVAAAVLAIVLFLAFFNWNMLRGPIARQASAMSGRPIRIDGDLKVHLLSWTPSASIGGLKIGNPAWMHGGDLGDVQTLNVSVKLLPLLVGRIELPLLDLEQPKITLFQDATGRANWANGGGQPSKPFKLPPIQHFVINSGDLKMVNLKKKLTVVGTVQSSETAGGAGSFQLSGKGAINNQPFLLNFSGAPLIHVRADQPYAFDADVRAGATRVVAHGALHRPFDFGQLDTSLVVSGPDFADLYYLTGLALPNTGVYRLSGQLNRDNRRYAFNNVAGRVGDSDLEGSFVVDNTSGRPNLRAALRSRSLDFKDLAPLIGAPTRGERHTPLQTAQAAQLSAQGRILPDATLSVTRLRSMDAVVSYRAETVKATPHLPLRKVSLDVTLDHAVLTLDPVSFGFPRGALAGSVRIDARGEAPLDDVDLRLTNVRLEDFLGGGASAPLEGLLEARAKLHGTGDSVHKAASTANGDVTVVAPRGKMRRAFAELLGVDVVKGLGLFLSKDQSDTSVRCAVASFHATNGLLTSRTLVLDTDPVLAQGQGTINLGTEGLDLTLLGHPKRFQLVHVKAPIAISGHLAAPHIGVNPGPAATQAAASVALGAVLTPLASILPFVDAGLTKDADCSGLVTDARSMGAPVKVSQTTTTPSKGAKK